MGRAGMEVLPIAAVRGAVPDAELACAGTNITVYQEGENIDEQTV